MNLINKPRKLILADCNEYVTRLNGRNITECGNTTALVLEADKNYHCASIGLYESNDVKDPYDCDEELKSLNSGYVKPEIILYSRYKQYFNKSYADCENEIKIRADKINLDGKIVNELLENKIKQLENENNNLKTRVEKLEGMIEEMFKYSPTQEGYEEAKKDFESKIE